MHICAICGEEISEEQKIIVLEQMQGTNKPFEYYHCKFCGCLQIGKLPIDLKSYYTNYYTIKKKWNKISNFKLFFWGIRSALSNTILYKLFDILTPNQILSWTSSVKLKKNARILDIGCGYGDVLFEFKKHGFKNLYGVDPYIEDDFFSDGINILKTDIFSVNDKYDFIMLNHSFEHIWEQHETIAKIKKLLNPKGHILIRMPIIGESYEHYKENWVQLDAPRHLIIHSTKSFGIFCKMNGINIKHTFYDSTEFQFLGSEEFKKGIASNSPKSYLNSTENSIFTVQEVKKFKLKAKALNREARGDQAGFILTLDE